MCNHFFFRVDPCNTLSRPILYPLLLDKPLTGTSFNVSLSVGYKFFICISTHFKLWFSASTTSLKHSLFTHTYTHTHSARTPTHKKNAIHTNTHTHTYRHKISFHLCNENESEWTCVYVCVGMYLCLRIWFSTSFSLFGLDILL